MIAQAIQKIIEISNGELKEVEGRICSTRELHPVLEPEVHAVRTTTLNGLVDYIKGVSDFPRERVFLHVQHHNKVSLTTQVSGPFMQRQTFAVAERGGWSGDSDHLLIRRCGFLRQRPWRRKRCAVSFTEHVPGAAGAARR